MCELPAHWRQGSAPNSFKGVLGRVCSSQTEPDELNKPYKPAAWVLAPDGIEHMWTSSMVAGLEGLGFDGGFIYNRLKAGDEFYLVLCDSAAVGQVYPATWDGVLQLLEQMHGAGLTAKVAQHLDRYDALPNLPTCTPMAPVDPPVSHCHDRIRWYTS